MKKNKLICIFLFSFLILSTFSSKVYCIEIIDPNMEIYKAHLKEANEWLNKSNFDNALRACNDAINLDLKKADGYRLKSIILKKMSEQCLIKADDIDARDEAIKIKSLGNTNGNIVNSGYMVRESANSLYYSVYKNDVGYIYNVKDGKTIKIYSMKKANISNLNLVGKFIYYIKNNNIYKLKLSTTIKKDVKVSNDIASYLIARGSYLYYVNNSDCSKIYRINIKNNIKAKISEDRARYINLIRDTIYYSNIDDKMRLYRIKVDGTDRQMVLSESCFYVNVANDWIYYGKQLAEKDPRKDPYYNLLCKVKLDGTEKTELDSECDAEYINVIGNYVYYANERDGNKLYRINVDGTDKQKVSNDNCFNINLINNLVYYYKIMNNGAINLCKIKYNGTNKQIIK